jgi:putative membrane protein
VQLSRVLYLAFAFLVGIGGLAFYVRNDQVIELNYFVGTVTVELSLVVVGALVLGALLGMLAMTATVLALKREVRRLARRHQVATRELASLREVSFKDAG